MLRLEWEGSLLAEFPVPPGRSVFALSPLTDCRKPTCIMEGNLLHSLGTDLSTSEKYLHSNIQTCLIKNLAILTHKINHHTSLGIYGKKPWGERKRGGSNHSVWVADQEKGSILDN